MMNNNLSLIESVLVDAATISRPSGALQTQTNQSANRTSEMLGLGQRYGRTPAFLAGGIDDTNDPIYEESLSLTSLSVSDFLFQDPPPRDECPICLSQIPVAFDLGGRKVVYQPCCGKMICGGCMLTTAQEMEEGTLKKECPLCRTPTPSTSEEAIERLNKRIEMGDAMAIARMGFEYKTGGLGILPVDDHKALELWHHAGHLGCQYALFNLAMAYMEGRRSIREGFRYYVIAAVKGHEAARLFLGVYEECSGNIDRAMKHYMIAASAGEDNSVKAIGEGYKKGFVTKDDYENTLRAYQRSQDEMVSRTKARARGTGYLL